MFRILYVDDEPALLDLGKIFLELSGQLLVDTVSSVEDALGRLMQQRYDGIISDYQMPGRDGIEFLKYVRSRYPDLPFILFTGRGREEIVIEALNSGADFYLQKGGEHKSQFVELEHKITKAIDRKRINDELLESKQRMADIINFLPDATFAVNNDHKVIAWNRTIEEMTGIPSEHVIGTRDYSYARSLYGEDKALLVDLILNKNKDIEKQYPFLNRIGDKYISETYAPSLYNGKGAHLWLVASPLYDARGNVIGAIEAIRDITQRKTAEEEMQRMHADLHAAYEQLTVTEEELRQNYDELSKSQQELHRSEDRYRSVVEDQTEFICRFSPDGKLTFVNDAYCRYFGLAKSSCLGKHHTVTIPAEDQPLMNRHLAGLTPSFPVASIEHRVIMPDGSVRWQLWNDRAIFDANGKIIEFQSVGEDITRRREAEDTLRLMHDNLHAAYEQLTATEEELRQNYEELNKSQQELFRSEERYRNIVEDQTEFICRFTPDGKLTFVNDAYCRYFGLAKSSCIGKHHTVTIPAEDLAGVKEQLGSLTPANPVGVTEHRIIMPDGSVQWQHWIDRAIFDPRGNIIEYQSVGREITRRKEAEDKLLLMNEDLHAAYEQLTATEEELRQNYDELSKSQQELHRSEERYRSVVEDQTEFICRFSPDGKLTFVNDAYCRYFGLSRVSCLGQHHTVNIPPEDLPRMKKHLAALTPENPAGPIEHRIIMPDGSIRWQYWNERAIFDTTGRLIEYQSVGKDITGRREAEEQMKIMHENLHAAYEQLTATEEELRQNYEELSKSQQELHQSEERYRSVVEDQTEFICRFTPDGKITFVNEAYCGYFRKNRTDLIGQRFRPEIPEEDQPMMHAHFASICPDRPAGSIEHRIRMPDKEIRWQHWSDRGIFDNNGILTGYQSVGRDVTERKHMEEALAESNRKLNLLSGITRHDILNQLTGLQGYHALLLNQITSETQKTWLENAERAAEVIRSQISFTQQYQDIGMQKPLWQNVGECIRGVCREGSFSSVGIDPQVENIEIFADPLLKTVFYNLFENAIMHGVSVRNIRVSATIDPDHATLIIEDDGTGIPQDSKIRIFEKGFGKHTGLGLFLVKEVLDITGLTIRETGIPGTGARFGIDIPRGRYKITGR